MAGGGGGAPESSRFARAAEQLVAGLADRERGLLASALIAVCDGTADGAAPVAALLRLDSADPSLMSRADVARLLAHLEAQDSAALRRAFQAFRDDPAMHATLDGLFAPAREDSDTSGLGGDPTIGTAWRERQSDG